MRGGLKAVTPVHVLALVLLANVLGAVVLLVEYLVVLPFPDEVSTDEIVRDNVVLGFVCIGLSDADEGVRWRLLEPLLLRGRAETTVLAVPA